MHTFVARFLEAWVWVTNSHPTPISSGIEQQRYAFDRARRVLSWYIVFSFWYNLWTNPGTMYRKCLIFYSLFFKVFLNFVHEERVEDKK